MLLEIESFKKLGVNLTGVIHVGMHQAEEYQFYKNLDIQNICFIEANRNLCDMVANTDIGNDPSVKIINAAILDVSGLEIDLNVTNNVQSSSLLQLGDHKLVYPHIVNVETIKVKTKTLDQCMATYDDPAVFNFLLLDIQGVELQAMKGLKNWTNINMVYTEVNYREMYKGCALVSEIDDFLFEKGFKKVEEVDTGCGWGDALYIKSDV